MKSNVKVLLFSCAVLFVVASGVCNAASFSTTPTADAYVATGATGELSTNNYGGGGALGLAAAGLPLGEFQSVIKFGLSGARDSFDAQFGAGLWTLQSVTLQLTASPHNNPIYNEIAAGQFSVSLLQNNSWIEGTGNGSSPTTDGITFSSLQNTFINNAADQALGTFNFGGSSSGANNYTLALSSGLIADLLAGSDLSLRLFAADDAVSYLFSSRAASAIANRPTLIFNAIPEPGSTSLCLMALGILWLRRKSSAAVG